MVRRSGVLALIFIAASSGWLGAQTYPSPPPAARTTDPAALRALASQREIHERFTLGIDALRRNDWNAAAAEFERIIALHPVEPQGSTAHYDVAIAYAHMNRLDDAAANLRAALASDPGFLAAMANLIAVDLQRGDLTAARKIADRFVAQAPDSARALYSRGIVALRAGDNATAESDFGQLLRADPQYALAHYNLGLAQTRLGRYASAEHEFSVALDLAPHYARARFALGAVLLKEGRRNEARAAFALAVRDASGDPVLQNLAVAMRDSIRQ